MNNPRLHRINRKAWRLSKHYSKMVGAIHDDGAIHPCIISWGLTNPVGALTIRKKVPGQNDLKESLVHKMLLFFGHYSAWLKVYISCHFLSTAVYSSEISFLQHHRAWLRSTETAIRKCSAR